MLLNQSVETLAPRQRADTGQWLLRLLHQRYLHWLRLLLLLLGRSYNSCLSLLLLSQCHHSLVVDQHCRLMAKTHLLCLL